ncbi:helix-turn-helix domain-containing protein [Actinocatenispora comari]|uniref:HTH cro/C1-type domain-containing protein n=1 Tax=Actinocatenispora comari TaxID=2807577 RepID=A0A8J4A9E5_9ACTN|nr:helix-turn-helix transcriptional regulator [Actinocatenispora comari]GIL25542.1 hypothetical protein NUM_07970 [Actinocatenispora comari]
MARYTVSHFQPEALRAERQKAGWTQTSLAKAVGRNRSQIARWESGDQTPGVEVIRALARALQISPGLLAPLPIDRPVRLSDLRVAAQLTQKQTACGLGIAHGTYVRIERGVTGRITDERIRKLAALFHTDKETIVAALNIRPLWSGRSTVRWSVDDEPSADSDPLITTGSGPDGRRWVLNVDFGAGVRIDENGKIRDRNGAQRALTPSEARARANALRAAASWVESGRLAQFEQDEQEHQPG